MVQVRHYCAYSILLCALALSCSVTRAPAPPADPRLESELLTRRAQVLYSDTVRGKLPQYRHWLDFV